MAEIYRELSYSEFQGILERMERKKLSITRLREDYEIDNEVCERGIRIGTAAFEGNQGLTISPIYLEEVLVAELINGDYEKGYRALHNTSVEGYGAGGIITIIPPRMTPKTETVVYSR